MHGRRGSGERMGAADSELVGATGVVALNGFRFDLDANSLLDGQGAYIQLRPQCLSVLRCLAQKAGQVVTKDELMHAVWPGMIVTDDSLVQCIGALRQALGDVKHRIVQTETRRGYRLVPSRAPTAVPKVDSEHAGRLDPFGGELSQEVRFATSTDGIRIAYASVGDGVPVVRAGGTFSHLLYDIYRVSVLREVARTHRLIRFDWRGQGLSDRDVCVGSLADLVRDLQAVVDAQGLSRFVLWGIGEGAATAIRFAALYPERVERLILSAGTARGASARKDETWLAIAEAVYRFLEVQWDDPNDPVRHSRIASRWPGATPETVHLISEVMRLSCAGSTAASAQRVAAEADVSAELGQIRCRTLVTHSKGDPVTPIDEFRSLAGGIPGARLVRLNCDNCWPLAGEPAFDALAQVINEFIDEDRDARRAIGADERDLSVDSV
jgi:pimeloyl-ACP methyl ester carboxylesterase/DNA-binding winged helix-turn-helix (wHTH) protein